MSMTTLRKMLKEVGFDWDTGTIILENRRRNLCHTEDPELDRVFYNGFGSPDGPSFVADDSVCIYWMQEYDGSQYIGKVYKNISRYLKQGEDFPS